MNNNRLSSNLKNKLTNLTSPSLQDTVDTKLDYRVELPVQIKPDTDNTLNHKLLQKKIKNLLNKPSNFEIFPDGKILIKSEQKF